MPHPEVFVPPPAADPQDWDRQHWTTKLLFAVLVAAGGFLLFFGLIALVGFLAHGLWEIALIGWHQYDQFLAAL